MEQDTLQELIQIHKEDLLIILDILNSMDNIIKQDISNHQHSEANLKAMLNLTVNKVIIHNNNLI